MGTFNYLEAILMTREIVDGNIWWLYWLLETTLIWDSSSSWQHFCYRNLLYSSEDCIHSILNPCTSTYWSIHRKFHIPVQKPHRFLWHTAWHSYRDRAHKFRFWYFSRNLPRKLHLYKKNSPKHDPCKERPAESKLWELDSCAADENNAWRKATGTYNSRLRGQARVQYHMVIKYE